MVGVCVVVCVVIAMRVAVMEGMRMFRLRGLGIVGGRSSVLSVWKKTCNASSSLAITSIGMQMSSLSDLPSSEGSLWGSCTLMFSGSLVGSTAPSMGPQFEQGIDHSSFVIESLSPAICHTKYCLSLTQMLTHMRNLKLNLMCFHPLYS